MADTSPPATDEVATELAASQPNWTVAENPLPPFRFATGNKLAKPWRPRGKSRVWTMSLPEQSVCWIDKVNLQPPLDQDPCNSCTAFALCAVMGDLSVIRAAGSAAPLSPGFVHRCLGACECSDPLDPGAAVRALKNRAVPPRTDGDFPYPAEQCATAHGVLKLIAADPLRNQLEAKLALAIGPIFGVMDLWDDFWRFYRGGIYRHISGRYLATHAIEIVGYDEYQSCWYVKNSRGSQWGERGGYGRIAYGECGIFTAGGNGGLQLRI